MGLPELLHEIQSELTVARRKFPAFHSGHEGYGVILEELDELWDEIRRKNQDKGKMRLESIQVAAMAIRFALDICEKE